MPHPTWLDQAADVCAFDWGTFQPIFQRHYLDGQAYADHRDRFLAELSRLIPLAGAEDTDWDSVERALRRAADAGAAFQRCCEKVNVEALAELPDGQP